jgi:hypothetical protein
MFHVEQSQSFWSILLGPITGRRQCTVLSGYIAAVILEFAQADSKSSLWNL